MRVTAQLPQSEFRHGEHPGPPIGSRLRYHNRPATVMAVTEAADGMLDLLLDVDDPIPDTLTGVPHPPDRPPHPAT